VSRRNALLLGGSILLAADAVLLVGTVAGHHQATEALAAQLGWSAMSEDPDVARWLARCASYLDAFGLAAQIAAVWFAMRWSRWRVEPAGTSRSPGAVAVLVTALLWTLGNAAGVLFELGAGGEEGLSSVRESLLGWRALLDLANAAALAAAWRWRPWRRPSAAALAA
jgi:hypothetical protein